MQRLVLWMLTDVVPKYYIDCSWGLWWGLLFCEIVIALACRGPKIRSLFLSGNWFLDEVLPSVTRLWSLQLLGSGQKAILVWCLFSCKIHTAALFSFWKHSESRFTSLAAVQVSLQWSPWMDSSHWERLLPDNLQYTNMSYWKKFL